ncbi:MAG TPA: hypothetical protein VGS14_01700 [Actinomycetes bacterium]|jgi:hypothetical protein|nr:hypothetical protein [Actinomycetes bacterium]
MENTVGPLDYGPFSITVEELPPTGDHLELLFKVERDGLDLGSVIVELSRSVARTVGGQVQVHAHFLATARTRLEEFLDDGGSDQLTLGKPIRLPRIDSTDRDFIDGLAESDRPAQ